MAKKRRKDEKPVLNIEEIYGPEVAAAFAQRMHEWFDELDFQGMFPPQRSAEIVPFPHQPKKRHRSDGGTA